MSPSTIKTIYEFTVNALDGSGPLNLRQLFHGHPVLIVNVATKCGLTAANYEQLQQLDARYHAQGLRILLFPCNQFAGQEPGDSESICHYIQGISPHFIVADKVKVNGEDAHPLYQWMKSLCPGFLTNAIKWNFTKFLVDKEGVPVKRFGPRDEPLTFEEDIKALL